MFRSSKTRIARQRLAAWIAGGLAAAIAGTASAGEPPIRYDFDDLQGWRFASAEGSPDAFVPRDGTLRLSTRPQTRDRVRIATLRPFGAATYRWRVFVPAMGAGDQASIGAFLYRDDEHEFDFEIGYGTRDVRERLGAGEKELVAYCTSQGNPESTSQVLIRRNRWHLLELELAPGGNGNHLVTWSINAQPVKRLQTAVGGDVRFTVRCSVENLAFMGDHLPRRETYALFDFVEIEPMAGKNGPHGTENPPAPRDAD